MDKAFSVKDRDFFVPSQEEFLRESKEPAAMPPPCGYGLIIGGTNVFGFAGTFVGTLGVITGAE